MEAAVKCKWDSYPSAIKIRLLEVRQLVLDVAAENDLGDVEEALKWGELSYLVKGGSTVRCDWKSKNPEQFSIFFNCNTTLVDTFRELYSEQLAFEGNRAIVLSLAKPLPAALRHCVALSLQYKALRHLPLLGA